MVAKQGKSRVNLDDIINHVTDLCPRNMSWDDSQFDGRARELLENGGAKLKDYHGFDITERCLDTADDGAIIILEYNDRVVLNLAYENIRIYLRGHHETTRKTYLRVYTKGAWEAAFAKLIEMGADRAIATYVEQFTAAADVK